MRKSFNFTFLLIFVIFFSLDLNAQTIKTQAEVDNWDQSITEITDFITIQGDDITNVNALSNIVGITGNGNLHIQNCPDLLNLDGLRNLENLSGTLFIINNASLTNINAFEKLSAIEGTLMMKFNENLSDIEFLNALQTINGELIINFNESLLDIDGLSNLMSLNGQLTIEYNSKLADLDGLQRLNSLDGDLSINNNESLENIDGLNNINKLDGLLTIITNDNLKNIDGLNSIQNVNGGLIIQQNKLLDNISGLDNIMTIEGSLEILENDTLLNINGLNSLVSISGALSITDNNSLKDIKGLSNLNFLMGSINIENNTALEAIEGLDQLNNLEGQISIIQNEILTNISGLNSLNLIAGSLIISDNYELPNIDALTNINMLIGTLEIKRNNRIIHINGLNNITEVLGHLNIKENESLENLDGLSGLENFQGIINIHSNNTLSNLSGFSNLTNLNGILSIEDNLSLENLDGLDNITGINGTLIVKNNPSITSLNGLNQLATLNGLITIERNENLNSINGMNGITTIDGSISITANNTLQSLEGLENISILNGTINISNNNSLSNLQAINNITTLDGNLLIDANQSLTNLDDLKNLESIKGTLSIQNNESLVDMEGLVNLSFISGRLSIDSNPSLYECCILIPLLSNTIQSRINIFNNAEGCNSIEEIEASVCSLVVDHTTNPPCIGLNNGSIDFVASNYDTIPFNYSWEEIQSNTTGTGTSYDENYSINELEAGIYHVTVTTPNGEEYTIRFINLDPIERSSLDILQLTTENSTFGQDNGKIFIDFSGGTPPYSITLDGPSDKSLSNLLGPSSEFNNLLPGNYSLYLNDSNGQNAKLDITILDEELSIEQCQKPMDILILNLVSSAISAKEYSQSKTYFKKFYNSINLGQGYEDSRVAIAEWSGRQDQAVKINITGDDFELSDYDNLERSFTGNTDILSALQFGDSYLNDNARTHAQKVIIFTFDGCASFSAAEYAQELKEKGVIIADIGIGYVYSSTSYRNLLKKAATNPNMAYFGEDFRSLDPLQLTQGLNFAGCSASTSNIYFTRDGAISINSYLLNGNCPSPESVDLNFSISALEQLSLPAGTPVSFYHNDPTKYGASLISMFKIPCSISAGETESFSITIPIETSTQLYAILNDDGKTSPSFELPVTNILEATYTNNIDSRAICIDQNATIQALKSSVSLYPICENIVQYTVDVCNISDIDATSVTIQDIPPVGFELVDITTNTNNCSLASANNYDIPASCCISMLLSYDVSNAAQGYYGDQDVILDGPDNQVYLNFNGENTTSEDILLNGQEDCGDPTVTFRKEVSHLITCPDHSMTYTYYIENKSSNPLYALEFIDILPSPLEWIYKPYNKSGLSIAASQNVEGQTASFIIDQIDAETVASFVIDVYVSYTDQDLEAKSEAIISGFPDYINNGNNDLLSNETKTTVLGDISIDLIDTILLKPTEYTVELSALISQATSINWSTSGDGYFSDSQIASPTYILGEKDKLDTLIGLSISIDTYCGEKGLSILLEKECKLAFNRQRPIDICEGDTHSSLLTWTGGNGPYTISEIDNSLYTEKSVDLDSLTAGIYTYTLEDSQGCKSQTELELNEMSLPDAVIEVNCESDNFYEISVKGNDIDLMNSVGMPINTLNQGSFLISNIPIADTIRLDIIDKFTNCENTQLITPPDCTCLALASAPPDQVITCTNNKVILDGSNSSQGQRFSLTWKDQDGNILTTETNYETTEPGIYTLEVIDNIIGCSTSDSVVVEDIRTEPIATIQSEGHTITCSINSIELYTREEQNIFYKWTEMIPNTIQTVDTLTINTPGLIKLTALDTTNGCSNETTLLIEIDTTKIEIEIDQPEILNCTNEVTQIDASKSEISTIQSQQRWLDTNNIEISADTYTIMTNNGGLYYFELTNNTNDCVTLDSVIVEEDYATPNISLDENYKLSCTSESISITPSYSIEDETYIHKWTKDNLLVSNDREVEIKSPGIYILETEHFRSTCTVFDTLLLTPPDNIEAIILETSNPICPNLPSGSISISDISGGTPGYSFHLNNELISESELNNMMAGEYELIIKDALGCKYDTLVQLIEPVSILLESDQELIYINEGSASLIELSTSLKDEEIESVVWQPAIPCDNCLKYLFEDIENDLIYTITITNTKGCKESLEIRAIIDSELKVYTPNVIGTKIIDNNVFFPQSGIRDLLIKEMHIYDSWGNKVFENYNFPANDPQYGWNGSIRNKINSGVYTYIFTTSYKNEIIKFAGEITVIN